MTTIALPKEDVALPLARNIVTTRYGDIPREAVETAKKSILDTLGVIVGASGTIPSIKGVVRLMRQIGGKRESTIIPFGVRVPAWAAAFANGAMAHDLDYDDVHHYARVHASSSVVPTAFAVAEKVGKVTGKEFISSVVLGQDLIVRLGYTIRRPVYTWHKTPVCAVFATTAVSGRLLGLDADRMADALGIALAQAGGTMELRYAVGSDLGGMYPAFPAKAGVLSAQMAESGIHGLKSCFEGKAGFFNVYFNGQYERDALTTGLGKKFQGFDTGYKPWPACANTHPFIDGTLGIISEHNIQPEDIQEIIVYVGEDALNLCQPLENRRKPATILDAKYSIPFTVAVAATKKNVVIGDYTAEGIRNPVALEMAQRVTPKFDAEFNPKHGASAPGQVEVRTKDGRSYVRRVDSPYGHPKNPLPTERLIQKFRDCCQYSAKPLKPENIERVIELITNLEKVDNVSEIVPLLT